MELNDLTPVVVTILLVGLVLGIGIYVLAEFSSQLATDEGSVTNETGLWINDTASTVDKATENGFHSFSVSVCYANVTGASTDTLEANATIGSGNYTTNSDRGTILGASGRDNNYTDVGCSYTYNYGGEATGATDDTITGLGDFAGWIAVIVVVIAAAIVLGIVLRSFGTGARA